jgi:hypothetical protein
MSAPGGYFGRALIADLERGTGEPIELAEVPA